MNCKFCHRKFGLLDIKEYINHLWRFHRDGAWKLYTEICDEIKRLENIPK